MKITNIPGSMRGSDVKVQEAKPFCHCYEVVNVEEKQYIG
jgi:hypothetical protein